MTTKPNEPDGLDLRPWGYAPGSYIFKCIDCPEKPPAYWPIGDKRSIRCEQHAREAMERAPAQPVADAGGVTDADRKLFADLLGLDAVDDERDIPRIMAGEFDDWKKMRWIVAFRLQSVAAATAAKDAEIAWIMRVIDVFRRHYELNDCDGRTGNIEIPVSALRAAASLSSALSEAREAETQP